MHDNVSHSQTGTFAKIGCIDDVQLYYKNHSFFYKGSRFATGQKKIPVVLVRPFLSLLKSDLAEAWILPCHVRRTGIGRNSIPRSKIKSLPWIPSPVTSDRTPV